MPWASTSYGVPLLPVIYHWYRGGCFLSSQLPLWSSARQLLDSRMAPKLLSVLPKESSSFLLGPWSPWKEIKHNGLPPLCLIKLKRGKRSHTPVACEHALVWGFPSRLALALRVPDAQFCVRVQIFLSCTFHLWGPSSVPSDITEDYCLFLPMIAPQWPQDSEYISSWVFSEPNRLIHPSIAQ